MLAEFILALPFLRRAGGWRWELSALPRQPSRNGSMSDDMSDEGGTRPPLPRLLTMSLAAELLPVFPRGEKHQRDYMSAR